MARVMADPEKREQYHQRQREGWAEKKVSKAIKTVADDAK